MGTIPTKKELKVSNQHGKSFAVSVEPAELDDEVKLIGYEPPPVRELREQQQAWFDALDEMRFMRGQSRPTFRAPTTMEHASRCPALFD